MKTHIVYRVYNAAEDRWKGNGAYSYIGDENKGKLWYNEKLAKNTATRLNNLFDRINRNSPNAYCRWRDHGYTGRWEAIAYEIKRVNK